MGANEILKTKPQFDAAYNQSREWRVIWPTAPYDLVL